MLCRSSLTRTLTVRVMSGTQGWGLASGAIAGPHLDGDRLARGVERHKEAPFAQRLNALVLLPSFGGRRRIATCAVCLPLRPCRCVAGLPGAPSPCWPRAAPVSLARGSASLERRRELVLLPGWGQARVGFRLRVGSGLVSSCCCSCSLASFSCCLSTWDQGWDQG